jgi:Domain of unknown function (DUF4386)
MDVRKIGKVFGWLFIATFVTSFPARLLFVSGLGADWQHMRFIPGALSENRLYLGAILEFGVILANVATAIVLYPVVRRRFEAGAIGYVAARIMESAFILVGLVSLISVVSVSQQLAGASGATAAALTAQGGSLVSTYQWAFLFGPGLVVGFGNGLLLGYLMYRSGLVPRRMAMIGIIGGPMLILSFVFTLFGVYRNGSGPSFLMALPEIVWEASLGIYAAWKGFRSSPSDGMVDVREAALEPRMAVV